MSATEGLTALERAITLVLVKDGSSVDNFVGFLRAAYSSSPPCRLCYCCGWNFPLHAMFHVYFVPHLISISFDPKLFYSDFFVYI